MTLTPSANPAFPAQNDPEVQVRLGRLADIVDHLLARAAAGGATQAEASCSESAGLNVNVRLGEVETLEYNQDRSVGISVYVGKNKGSATTADLSEASLQATIDQALAIARYTQEDAFAGLADPQDLATTPQDFDQWHPWQLTPEQAIDLATACEAAGRDASPEIRNSEGASVGSGHGVTLYGNSHGFRGATAETHHSMGAAFIAGEGELMQRDGWYDFRIDAAQLDTPQSIGAMAAQKAVERLHPRSIPTGTYPVLFEREMSRSLLGHLLGALAGSAQYRKTTFLADSVGELVLPEWITITEDPFLQRGLNSAWFDGDGVATQATDVVTQGRVARYLLGPYSARKLGLTPNGNSGGTHNLQVSTNAATLQEMVAEMGTGLLVTSLMGQGVNAVTGDYSRGAGGFWVENGQIQYPVDGITIAGNLRDMLGNIRAIGADFDHRTQHRIGSVWIVNMTVAGN